MKRKLRPIIKKIIIVIAISAFVLYEYQIAQKIKSDVQEYERYIASIMEHK